LLPESQYCRACVRRQNLKIWPLNPPAFRLQSCPELGASHDAKSRMSVKYEQCPLRHHGRRTGPGVLFPSLATAASRRPLAGKYRGLVDTHFQLHQLRPQTNLFVTQFNSASLHRTIANPYKFDISPAASSRFSPPNGLYPTPPVPGTADAGAQKSPPFLDQTLITS